MHNKPRILLNALKLHQGPYRLPTGNFQNVLYLAEELGRTGEFDIRYLTDLDSHAALAERVGESRLECVTIRGDSVLAADWAVYRAVSRLRPQIYHRPTGQLPFFRLGCKTVSGIADLSFRTLAYPPMHRLYKEISYRWTVKVADRVICVSRYTHDEVSIALGVHPTKLRVIHHGANILPPAALSQGLAPLEPYFLVFAHQVHKNAELCFNALARIRSRSLTMKLAVVGKNEYVDRVLRPLANRLGIDGAIVYVGAPSAAQLAGLYDKAIALLFPSRFEGFGMPVLEAMSRGCPVICSNVCSLPEVAGDAAVLLAPDDLHGMISSMLRLQSEPGWRAHLITAGHAQAEKFTWKRTAECTETIYRELLAEGK